MYAQQICGDYFLFFNRKDSGLGMRNFRIYAKGIEPDFITPRPKRLEADLKNISGKSLGGKAVVLIEDNDGENGIKASVSKEGGLTVKMNDSACDFLDINNELFATLKGDGIVRINYGISSFFN